MSADLVTLLLQLRLRAFAPTDALAVAGGFDPVDVDRVLVAAESDRLVQRRDGRVVGWTLTASGRRRGQELLVAELDAAGARERVLDAYLDFLPLNAELLSICTDWQVVVVGEEHLPNDHADPLRDAAVLARLDALHPAALRVTDSLAAAVDRFEAYGRRLDHAHARVAAGGTEWLTRATGDSYHGVWFELHEHLLAVLGHERTGEPVPTYMPTPTASGNGDNP